MHRRLIFAVAFLALGCSEQTPAPPESVAENAAPAQIADPGQVIRPIYDRYLTPQIEDAPPFSRQAPWSAAMTAAILALEGRANIDPTAPALEFDPFIRTPGAAISDVQVTTDAVVENSHATSRAAFLKDGVPDEVVYDLVWEDGGWKIDNMRGSDWDLRAFLQQSVTP